MPAVQLNISLHGYNVVFAGCVLCTVMYCKPFLTFAWAAGFVYKTTQCLTTVGNYTDICSENFVVLTFDRLVLLYFTYLKKTT